MNKREPVQALMDSVQQGNFENAESMLADDFRFNGPVSEPIDQEAWVGMNTRLQTAFPDLDYPFKLIGAEGDVVRATMQLSGTHTGAFDRTNMDMGVMPATNKNVSVEREKKQVVVKENKFAAWFVEPLEGADLQAILVQPGVKTTIM